ncbi:isopeptide-forming domain-containing fimbrial protein [Thomasclavelia cocleata]|uniref:Fimbrial isopeptide formation D2 domain-containing protein n=1 Tax=Thomasclavelia cocleata TaxID=69824 RepID=A0A1I0CN37_9FIRM|nr:isopeptide-forming domain-containing fimbrial protein [Thomasclavelia cocleata]MCR1960766.1 isopeptide-forming domain-containing fimbrial protein [Thomasclavelia cocleata]NDO42574.1 isopeptide-forming domain-containing fimbrial protein [Thomasclavelia cocleata]PJN81132.1 isopeptide-forming domain-containing fimbrial protein [Thomasclavelia cocleata]SET21004.1 fimbrial isopeptide formation D2 domain-containing protein [Thomasclavelia cocleata]
MNNKIKKSIVGLLAVSTAFSGALATATLVAPNSNLITSVSAKEQGCITINANIGDNGEVQSLAGKKFNVYRIFDAENSVGMESINYTMNPAYEKSLKKVTGKNTEYSIIDYIQTMNNNTVINNVEAPQLNESRYSNFRYFIESLRNMLVADKAEPTQVVTVPASAKESYTLDVPFGWYVIDEITNVAGEHSASSLCMVNTANPNVFINIKSDFPVIQKQIREDDLRTSIGKDHDGWNDVADFEIGQTVPYRYLTYAPNMNGYDSYYFALHDKMDEELTFNSDSVTVKIADKTLVKDTDYKVVTTGIPVDETFQIQIMDLKATINKYFFKEYEGANPEMEKYYGQEILIEYNATLNEKATDDVGRPGFENDVKLEYSNNPDSDGIGQTGETPWDTVVCFTFRMDGVKVNDQTPERPLEGAKFRLYSDSLCTKEVYVKKADNGDDYIVINRDSVTDGEVPAEAVEMVSDADGLFNIVGLDSQTYYLKETKAPAGYRLLKDPIKINIKATYSEDNRVNYTKGDGATNKTLQKLEATAQFKEFYTGEYSEYVNNLTTDLEKGSLNIKVVNKVGSKLPATGSAMTVMLAGTGTAMMLTALIKRKKEAEK